MSASLWTRRGLLGAMAASAATYGHAASAEAFCSDAAPAEGAAAKALPLGRINSHVRWGAAIEAPALYDPRLRKALAAEEPRFLAIASGLKSASLYPKPPDTAGGPPVFNWSEADDVAAFAAELGVPVRGDCLVWNDWLPDWIKDIAARRDDRWRAQLDGCLLQVFQSVFTHMAALNRQGRPVEMRWCGVVNEPFDPWRFHSATDGWRPGPWLDAFSYRDDGVPAYIHRAFELAETYRSPSTTLFLNEAHCENDHFGPQMKPALLRLVDSLQKAGRAVDAVGLECHLMPQWMADRDAPDWGPFKSFLRELAQRQVAIFITELDVIDCSLRDSDARDALVARYMSTFVAAVLETGVVEMISNWDFSDKYSWLRGGAYASLGEWAGCVVRPPCPRPDLYDQSMEPKPARAALARALAGKA